MLDPQSLDKPAPNPTPSVDSIPPTTSNFNPEATPFIPQALTPKPPISQGDIEPVPSCLDDRFATFGVSSFHPIDESGSHVFPGSLKQRYQEEGWSPPLLGHLASVFSTIEKCHSQGMVHGAITPENVLIHDSQYHHSASLSMPTEKMGESMILPQGAFPVHSSVTMCHEDGTITATATPHMDRMAWAALHAYLHPALTHHYEAVRENPHDLALYTAFLQAGIAILPHDLIKRIFFEEYRLLGLPPFLMMVPLLPPVNVHPVVAPDKSSLTHPISAEGDLAR